MIGIGMSITHSLSGALNKTLVKDSFNRADSTSLGKTDTKQTWSVLSGNFEIRSNQAYAPTPSALSVVDCGVHDYEVSADSYNNRYFGLAFCVKDANNYYLFRLNPTGVDLFSMIDGVSTKLAGLTADESAFVFPVKLRVIVNYKTFTCYAGNTLVGKVTVKTDNTFRTPLVGLRAGTFDNAGAVDNFLVQRL